MTSSLARIILAACLASGAALRTAGSSATWGSTPLSGNLALGTNWLAGLLPDPGVDLVFDATTQSNLTIATGLNVVANNLLFQGASRPAYTFSGTGAGITPVLTLLGGITVSGSTASVSFNNSLSVVLDGSQSTAHTASVLTGATVTVGASISESGGANSLVKTGGGTLVLSGANTYSGGTTIGAGTLQVGNGGTTGSILGNVVNNGIIRFTRSDNVTFAGNISGSGQLHTSSTGTLTLTGTHTYAARTSVGGGTLVVSGGSISHPLSFVSVNGSGSFSIINGGDVTATDAVLSPGATNVNTALVDGAGSTWVNSWSVDVGQLGSGTLTITNGGFVSGLNHVLVGDAGGSVGTIVLASGGDLVSGQSTVADSGGHIGFAAGSTGSVSLSGAGTTWASGGYILVGQSGTGSLTVDNGASVSAYRFISVGENTGSSGTMLVDNASVATASEGVTVGHGGTGTLTVRNGSSFVTNQIFIVGNVSGGTGTLNLASGGTFSAETAVVGWNSGGTGTLSLAGSGTALTVGSDLQIGREGSGTLSMTTGSSATVTQYSLIGSEAGGNGTVTVDSGASWNTGGGLGVGDLGNGTLLVTGGGVVTSGEDIWIGGDTTSTAAVTVTGSGSALTAGSSVLLGWGGTGSLTLSSSGQMSVDGGSGLVRLGVESGSTGTLNFGGTALGSALPGGVANVSALQGELGTATVQINTTATSGAPFYLTRNGASGGTAVPIAGTASLVNTAGYTVAPDTSSYTGTTTIRGGTLAIAVLANGGTASGIGAATTSASNLVIDGGTLKYTGTGHTTDRGFTIGAGATLDASGTGLVNFSGTGAVAFLGSNTNPTLTLTGSSTLTNRVAAVIGNNGAGATSLVKTGAGTWMLLGNNTYTGGTTISAGILQLGNNSSGGSVLGNITNNGQLTFSRSNNLTYSGIISGTGQLVKQGTGTLTLTANHTFTGRTSVSNGTLILDGGSISNPTTFFSLSNLGNMSLINGADLTNTDGNIAFNAGNVATMLVNGTGSTWTNSGNITLGQSGNGTLGITAGGSATAAMHLIAGGASGGSGTLSIAAGGSLVTGRSDVADSGAHIGYAAGGTGSATATGAGTNWTAPNYIIVGQTGTGTLSVGDSATVNAGRFLTVGYDPGSSGALTLQSGGIIASGQDEPLDEGGVSLGYLGGSSGSALVTDAPTAWINTGFFSIGQSGTGSLTVQNGAIVSSSRYTSLGENASGVGSMIVATGGSVVVAEEFRVANDGAGTISIQSGGTLAAETVFIGANAGSNGSMTVTDAGSLVTSALDLGVGEEGTGTLNIISGASVVNGQYGLIGAEAAGTGTVNLAGGASWVSGAGIGVGDVGTGVLTIVSGANALTPEGLWIGGDPGANGSVHIEGAGSGLSADDVYLGWGGTGSVTVASQGAFNVGSGLGTVRVGLVAGSSGTLNLGARANATATAAGLVNAAAINGELGSATVQFNTTSTESAPYYLTRTGTSSGTPVTLTGTTRVVNTAGYNVLPGANSFSGGMTLNGGTLVLGNAGSAGSGSITLAGGTLEVAPGIAISNTLLFSGSGGTIAGSGTFSAPLVAGTGVTLSPGDSPGTLTFTGGLTLASGGQLILEIADAAAPAGTGHDLIAVSGVLGGSGTSIDVAATSANPFAIRVVTLGAGGSPGAMANFNSANSYSWVFATAASGISGFSAGDFALDLAAFANGVDGGTFSFGESGGALALNFTPVPEPSTWAMMIVGAAATAGSLFRRRRS